MNPLVPVVLAVTAGSFPTGTLASVRLPYPPIDFREMAATNTPAMRLISLGSVPAQFEVDISDQTRDAARRIDAALAAAQSVQEKLQVLNKLIDRNQRAISEWIDALDASQP